MISLSILWYITCSAILQLLFLLFLFLFWSLCFNKYIFYRTKGKPTQCLMCLTGAAVPCRAVGGWRQNQNANKFCSLFPFSGVFLIYSNIKKYSLQCFLSASYYSTNRIFKFCCHSLDFCFLLLMFSGQKMELGAVKVRNIWMTAA